MKTSQRPKNSIRIGLVVPHMFMHRDILPQVIFSPGRLAIDLAEGLQQTGAAVTLFTPGPVNVTVPNVTADLTYFEQELAGRGDSYLDLLKKHPFTFVTLARQVQSELIATAFVAANAGDFDILHVYTNEEDTALPFAALCNVPVLFTHHDPFNFLVKYKNNFPKYRHLNWVSMSLAQRAGMPADTNWVANIYHGLDPARLNYVAKPRGDYIAFMGRIIESKGLHVAIAAAKKAGIRLKIAGKHYVGKKDTYWQERIAPQLGGLIEYVGFIKDDVAKQEFLGNARALVVPSLFEEPFGMVAIEALACGTPVIGMANGAIPEIIKHDVSGYVVDSFESMVVAFDEVTHLNRALCRQEFEQRFTLQRMVAAHLAMYRHVSQL